MISLWRYHSRGTDLGGTAMCTRGYKACPFDHTHRHSCVVACLVRVLDWKLYRNNIVIREAHSHTHSGMPDTSNRSLISRFPPTSWHNLNVKCGSIVCKTIHCPCGGLYHSIPSILTDEFLLSVVNGPFGKLCQLQGKNFRYVSWHVCCRWIIRLFQKFCLF